MTWRRFHPTRQSTLTCSSVSVNLPCRSIENFFIVSLDVIDIVLWSILCVPRSTWRWFISFKRLALTSQSESIFFAFLVCFSFIPTQSSLLCTPSRDDSRESLQQAMQPLVLVIIYTLFSPLLHHHDRPYVHHFVVLSTHIIFSQSHAVSCTFPCSAETRATLTTSLGRFICWSSISGWHFSHTPSLLQPHSRRRRQQLRALVALFLRNYFEKWKRWKHGSTTPNCLSVFSFVSAAQRGFSDVSSWRCCHVACVLYGFFFFLWWGKSEQEGRKFFLLNQPEREHFCQHQVDAARGISRVFPFIQSRKCAPRGARSRRIAYMRENSKLSDSFTFFIIAR